ncbi:hypothetical protein MMC10_002202 [Thelotrema lepadinum]|nr:hypothetical protein [Thelotrema lepadinum]
MLDYTFDFPSASQLKRYPASGINVLIVGGGLGGLFAAINCYRKGHNVKVLESAKEYDSTNGGFIRIGGSVLDSLDNFPGLRAAFEVMDQNAVYTVLTHDGDTVLGPIVMPKGGGVSNAGMNVHRSSLNRCLYEYAAALGIEVAFGTRITEYHDDGEKGSCVSKTGERFEADVVVAADGIGSRSAEVVRNEGEEGKGKSSGYAAYRCTYSAEEAYKDPNIKNRFLSKTPGAGAMNLWLAPHGYAVIFTNDDVVNFHIIHPDTDDVSERWDHKTAKSSVLSYIAHDSWHPDVTSLVNAAPEENIYDWRLMFRNPKPNWLSPHGRVVQLGDAAHTFLPSSGNGATQALEDGICLASCLQLAGRGQIPLAGRVYNLLRFQRTSCAQKIGFKNRNNWIGVKKDEAKARMRNQVGSWITSHDPEKYTYEKYGVAARALVTGGSFENDNIPPGHKYQPWSMEDFLSGKADREAETGDWS